MRPFINLLTLSYRRRQRIRRSLRKWSLVWLACLAAAVAAQGLAAQRSAYLRQQLFAAERSAAPLERLQQEQATLQGSLQATVAKGTVLGQVQDERPPLSLLGAISQSAHRCKGRLVVRHLGFERKERQSMEGNKSPPVAKTQQTDPEKRESWGCVTIGGSAVDNVAVATFVVGLRDSGLFRNVELKSSLRALDGKREIHCYVLECEI